MSTAEYNQIAQRIIKHQESIIGPMAWAEAKKVSGVSVKNHDVTIQGNGKTLESLVQQYATLFGQASVEACKDAVRPILPKLSGVTIPAILR